MPKCYITTHWPHPVKDDLPWHVYFKTSDRDRATVLRPGDEVLFYVMETVEGQKLNKIKKPVDGVVVDVLITNGGSVQMVAKVADGFPIPEPLPSDHPRYFYTGEEQSGTYDWGYRVVCLEHRRTRHCDLAAIKKRLNLTGNPRTWRSLLEVEDASAFLELVDELTR